MNTIFQIILMSLVDIYFKHFFLGFIWWHVLLIVTAIIFSHPEGQDEYEKDGFIVDDIEEEEEQDEEERAESDEERQKKKKRKKK